jgi:hypothetical protein
MLNRLEWKRDLSQLADPLDADTWLAAIVLSKNPYKRNQLGVNPVAVRQFYQHNFLPFCAPNTLARPALGLWFNPNIQILAKLTNRVLPMAEFMEASMCPYVLPHLSVMGLRQIGAVSKARGNDDLSQPVPHRVPLRRGAFDVPSFHHFLHPGFTMRRRVDS